MQVAQLREPFCNDYYPAWALLWNKKIYPFGTNKKSDFYELWQPHKQQKTMEMSEALPDIFNEGYVNQFQPEPTHKINK